MRLEPYERSIGLRDGDRIDVILDPSFPLPVTSWCQWCRSGGTACPYCVAEAVRDLVESLGSLAPLHAGDRAATLRGRWRDLCAELSSSDKRSGPSR